MAMFVHLADVVGDYLPAIQKSFFRNIVAAVIAAFVFFRASAKSNAKRPLAIGFNNWIFLLLRAIFGTTGIVLNFYALSHIPIGDAMSLNKTAPFFTVIFSWLIIGERVSIKQIFCIFTAFIGALFVIKPGFSAGITFPACMGLMSGLCAGSAYAFLHRLGKNGIDGSFIVLFFSVFSCVVCVPSMIIDYHPMNFMQILTLIGAGGGAAIGQFGITWAYRFAEPRQIAVYDYSGIIFAAILGFLAFGQIPDYLSIIGFVIIISMGAYLSHS